MVYLTFVGHAGVKSVVQPVTFEVDLMGHRVQERIFRQVVPVELSGQVRVVHVVDLRYARQRGLGGRGRVQLDNYWLSVFVQHDRYFFRVLQKKSKTYYRYTVMYTAHGRVSRPSSVTVVRYYNYNNNN